MFGVCVFVCGLGFGFVGFVDWWLLLLLRLFGLFIMFVGLGFWVRLGFWVGFMWVVWVGCDWCVGFVLLALGFGWVWVLGFWVWQLSFWVGFGVLYLCWIGGFCICVGGGFGVF